MDTVLHIMPLITAHSIWLGALVGRTRMPQESWTAIGFSFTGGKAALEDFYF